jgi:hypothetical protein
MALDGCQIPEFILPNNDHPTMDSPQSSSPKRKRVRSKFLIRRVLPSDSHEFVGRIYDLSVIALHFDSYEALANYSDCKYACDVNGALTRVVTRVESLNLAGNMLWPEPLPPDLGSFPISRYEWLTVAADVFLMRYISVVDCALLLVNEIFEFQLEPRACTLRNLRTKGISPNVNRILTEMFRKQASLRAERNARFHHGVERLFTRDDTTFKIAAIFENRLKGISGTDRFDRKINPEGMLKEGLIGLQRDFNRSAASLVRQLARLYDELWREFEEHFGPKIQSATHGLNVGHQLSTALAPTRSSPAASTSRRRRRG